MRKPLLVLALFAGCGSETFPEAATPSTASPPAVSSHGSASNPYPLARATPVVNAYHGQEVTDPYQWLEEADHSEVKQWVSEQNQLSHARLSSLPGRNSIAARVKQVYGFESPSYYPIIRRAGRYFASKRQPPKQQPILVTLSDPMDLASERVILDPAVIDPSGGTRIDWFEPSPDGQLVAVSLSSGGTESGDVHLFDVASGKATGEVIPRVQGGTAGGDLEWTLDGGGFFYTRYPAPGERPDADLLFHQQLYFHKLGAPVAEDRYELGKELPRVAEIRIARAPDSDRLLATVQKGDGGEFQLYLREDTGKWTRFSEFGDKIVQAAFGYQGKLYVLSRQQAPLGKLLKLQLPSLDLANAAVVIREGKDSIIADFWGQESILPRRNRLYLKYQTGGPSELRAFDLNGKPVAAPEQEPVSSIGAVVPHENEDLLFATGSFLRPWGWQYYNAKTRAIQNTPLSSKEAIDLSGVSVAREYAVSKDGTKVPVNILAPPGAARDGQGPCVVTGYGGYGISLSPRYRRMAALLLEQGVCYAVANLRGGGEFGEPWHRSGNLTKKQNVFDDFAASIQHLVAQKYTNSTRLAIMGGSNGGLLMGATLTQHPSLMRAVVSYVGIYDMLRVELSPNGAFNITEFGTVTNKAQFDALYAYSPYHRVQDGTKYPAALFLTGANDPRVDPMHSRKMVARLQAATTGDSVLLRQHSSSGHGGSKKLSDAAAETADVLAFILNELGQPFVGK